MKVARPVRKGADGKVLRATGVTRRRPTLHKVKRVVKLLCMVNCVPDFADPPKLANCASDLLVELCGEQGRHARSAVGMSSLPSQVPIEIEMIVEVAE